MTDSGRITDTSVEQRLVEHDRRARRLLIDHEAIGLPTKNQLSEEARFLDADLSSEKTQRAVEAEMRYVNALRNLINLRAAADASWKEAGVDPEDFRHRSEGLARLEQMMLFPSGSLSEDFLRSAARIDRSAAIIYGMRRSSAVVGDAKRSAEDDLERALNILEALCEEQLDEAVEVICCDDFPQRMREALRSGDAGALKQGTPADGNSH